MNDPQLPHTTVRSAEGVHLDMPLAGPAARILAYGVDFALVVVVVAAVGVLALAGLPAVTEQLSDMLPDKELLQDQQAFALAMLPLILLSMLVIYFGELAYYLFWELVTGGSSPGKRLVGLRVVRLDGLRVRARESLVRNAMRAVDVLPSTYAVGLTAMVVSAQGQRLGDMAAGTLVVRLDRPSRVQGPRIPADLTPWPLSRAQLARLGDKERQLIRGALRRADRVSNDERTQVVLQAAADAMVKRLQLDPEQVEPPLTLLQRLYLALEAQR